MKCPQGLHWIPDREFCSKCPPGQVFNAQWGECQGMDRTVINPGSHHTATTSLFGGIQSYTPGGCKFWTHTLPIAYVLLELALWHFAGETSWYSPTAIVAGPYKNLLGGWNKTWVAIVIAGLLGAQIYGRFICS